MGHPPAWKGPAEWETLQDRKIEELVAALYHGPCQAAAGWPSVTECTSSGVQLTLVLSCQIAPHQVLGQGSTRWEIFRLWIG